MIERIGDLLLGVGILIFGSWLFWRLTRGTTLFLVLMGASILLGIIFLFRDTLLFVFVCFLFLVVLSELKFAKIRSQYTAPQTILEGGGIRRGLTPIEIAEVIGISESGIVAIGLLNLIDKNFITLDQSNFIKLHELLCVNFKTINPGNRKKNRQQAALEMGKSLRIFEEYLLALLEENQTSPLSELRFQAWLEYFLQYVHVKLIGYDIEKTKDYYLEKIKHTISNAIDNPFENVAEWIVLATIVKNENIYPIDDLFIDEALGREMQNTRSFRWMDRIYYQILISKRAG